MRKPEEALVADMLNLHIGVWDRSCHAKTETRNARDLCAGLLLKMLLALVWHCRHPQTAVSLSRKLGQTQGDLRTALKPHAAAHAR